MDIIWNRTLDNRFKCKVSRVDEYTGLLTVTDENDNSLLCTQVNLSYGATFGPDVFDVDDWQNMCIKAVDSF